MRFIHKLLIVIVTLLALTACAEVAPWQRDILAQDGMQLTTDAAEAYAKQHTYFSREASTGGEGIGGGGCGCN